MTCTARNEKHQNTDGTGAPHNRAAEQSRPADARADTDALTHALRQSFQATVEEAVPDSLMDLIAKLK